MKKLPALVTVSALALTAGMASAQDVAREDTVIFDLDRTIKDPENFNWFTPGTKRMHGAHQTMWEPLFILNYETGEIATWLATGITSSDDMRNFTGRPAGIAKSGWLTSETISVWSDEAPLGYSKDHTHCFAVTLMVSAPSGTTVLGRYTQVPQKNIIAKPIEGMTDQGISRAVLCDALTSAATPSNATSG